MIERIVQRLAVASRPRAIAGMILAGVVGLIVAMPGVHWVVYFAGGGHGSIVPAYFLFGPAILVWRQVACSDPPGPHSESSFVSAMLCLFVLYAVILFWGRRRSAGKWVVLGVLCFHYLSVTVLKVLQPGLSSFHEFTKLVGRVSYWQSFGLIEYYFLLHIAAAAFAVCRWPVSRDGVKRTCLAVALVTLISFAYVSWAVAITTR